MSSIAQKLINVQSELKAPKNQQNTFGGYAYRSCEDILEGLKPLLKKEGLLLSVSDSIVFIGDRYYVEATAQVFDPEAECNPIAAKGYAREDLTKKGMDASQITGSASSYARKYALNGLFLIDDTKDDDTRAPEEPKKSAPPRKTNKPQSGVSAPARERLAKACEQYAEANGLEFREVMTEVAARADFVKTDACYDAIALELTEAS